MTMFHQVVAEDSRPLVVGSGINSSNSKASPSRMDNHSSSTDVLFFTAKACCTNHDQTAATPNAEEKPISPAAKQQLQQFLLVAQGKRAAIHINTMSVGGSYHQGAPVDNIGDTTTDGGSQPLDREQTWDTPRIIKPLTLQGNHVSGDGSSLPATPTARRASMPTVTLMASSPPNSPLNNNRDDDEVEDRHGRRPRAQSCNSGGEGCPLLNRSSDIIYLSADGHVPRSFRQLQQRHHSESREPSRLSSVQDRWNLFDKPVVRPGCPILSVTGTDNEIKYPDDLYYYPDDLVSDDEYESD